VHPGLMVSFSAVMIWKPKCIILKEVVQTNLIAQLTLAS
jgi:hypothetical protein